MLPIFQTDRLTLRQFTIHDTKFIIELLNSPGWLQFIGDRNVKTDEQAEKYLTDGPIKSYLNNGFGLSMVEMKENKLPIGMCGLIKRDYLENPDIGFAFLPEFFGNGYAYETAKATLEHANVILKIHFVSAITVADNVRSIRLLEKLGMRFKETIVPPGSSEELLLYNN